MSLLNRELDYFLAICGDAQSRARRGGARRESAGAHAEPPTAGSPVLRPPVRPCPAWRGVDADRSRDAGPDRKGADHARRRGEEVSRSSRLEGSGQGSHRRRAHRRAAGRVRHLSRASSPSVPSRSGSVASGLQHRAVRDGQYGNPRLRRVRTARHAPPNLHFHELLATDLVEVPARAATEREEGPTIRRLAAYRSAAPG